MSLYPHYWIDVNILLRHQQSTLQLYHSSHRDIRPQARSFSSYRPFPLHYTLGERRQTFLLQQMDVKTNSGQHSGAQTSDRSNLNQRVLLSGFPFNNLKITSGMSDHCTLNYLENVPQFFDTTGSFNSKACVRTRTSVRRVCVRRDGTKCCVLDKPHGGAVHHVGVNTVHGSCSHWSVVLGGGGEWKRGGAGGRSTETSSGGAEATDRKTACMMTGDEMYSEKHKQLRGGRQEIYFIICTC